MFSLSESKVQDLVEAISNLEDVGFIVSLKADMPGFVKLSSMQNVMVKAFIPQQKLLCQENKVKALVTHCGGHSITESLQCGKPLIGLPQGSDQFDLCYKA